MPDFNKGDFTQQGVNGHVNATVRLNEKRLVNIDMTSNEEAEGCTITGTVKDLLNNKVYNIGSGGGGGDFSTASVQVTFTEPSLKGFMPYQYPQDEHFQDTAMGMIFQSGTYTAILYKGSCVFGAVSNSFTYVQCTGDISYDVDLHACIISGDGTITVSTQPFD